jgi:dolichol-phosphate mannosyltransferase
MRASRVLSFSRNFGHQVAVTAGVDHARGAAVALIDADPQDPPELLPKMLERWREGYEVIYGQRARRAGESFFKLATAKAFYRIINRLSQVEIPLDTGDFRLMDRRVVEALKAMPERDRFVRGMVAWVGFKQLALPYDRDKRYAGDTKYPLKKMVRFAFDAILSFSTQPLQWTSGLGLIACLFAFLMIGYALGMRLFTSIWVSGWTLMFVCMLFIGGLQLITLGILGEYIGRIYMEAKKRPLYVIGRSLGVRTAAAMRPGSHPEAGYAEVG